MERKENFSEIFNFQNVFKIKEVQFLLHQVQVINEFVKHTFIIILLKRNFTVISIGINKEA